MRKNQRQKKQPNETVSSNKKKTTKAKKNVVPVRSSSPSRQSEESEEEKATTVVTQTKKTTPSNQVSKDKKVVTSTKNNDVQEKIGDNKKKQTTSGKGDANKKVNSTVLDKKQPVMTNSEVKRIPIVDDENGRDQEDEGQWVTQGNKQVSNRNRNKGKTETTTVNPPSSPLASKKRLTPTTSAPINKVESDVEPTPAPEPIEVCQLIPKTENRYTANDDWWKHALNHKQTFSVNDIGEWPEREQDEQYTVQVNRIVPVQNRNDI